QVSGRTVSCSLGTLKSGKSTKARIVVVPTRRGRIVDTATVSSDTPDPTADDNTTAATTKVRPSSGPCRHLIAGTSGDDRLKGTKRGDLIRAGAGNDVLSGRGGTDCLYAASGQDRLSGGPGRDRLFGGAGHDVIHAVGGGRDV